MKSDRLSEPGAFTGPALVFLSHSSKTPGAIAVRDAVKTALQRATDGEGRRRFTPWLDHDAVPHGDPWWRNMVNTAMVHCHAAIVLVSDEAIVSPYVAYEISVLIERKMAHPEFRLAAVTLVGSGGTRREVLLQTLRAVNAEPRAISRDRREDVQAVVAAIVEDLDGVQANAPPADPATRTVAELLRQVPDWVLDDIAAKLAMTPGWSGMENRHSRVAAILMSAGSRAAAATADMKPYCRPDEISRVLELAASGWANPFFADRIRDAVERRRTLIGLRLSNDRVLRLYLVRAFGPPGNYVVVWPASDVSSLNDDEAMTAIRRALCDAIKIEEHELTDWLNLRDRGDMVFVAIRATGLSGSLLQHLQHELRNVICLLTLDQDADDSHLRSLGVTIIPSTSDEDERKFSMTYLRNLRVLADRPSR